MTDTETPLRLWVYRTLGEVHVAIAHTDKEGAELCNIQDNGVLLSHWEVEAIPLADGPLLVLSSPPECIVPDVRAELTQARDVALRLDTMLRVYRSIHRTFMAGLGAARSVVRGDIDELSQEDQTLCDDWRRKMDQ